MYYERKAMPALRQPVEYFFRKDHTVFKQKKHLSITAPNGINFAARVRNCGGSSKRLLDDEGPTKRYLEAVRVVWEDYKDSIK